MRLSPFRVGAVILFTAILFGCSTRGTFVIPSGTQLEVYSRPATVGADGSVTMKPFGWNAMGIPPAKGIPYRLTEGGKVVQEGRLRGVFRGASLFWPPVSGIITWPVGFNPHITYDLVKGTQE